MIKLINVLLNQTFENVAYDIWKARQFNKNYKADTISKPVTLDGA